MSASSFLCFGWTGKICKKILMCLFDNKCESITSSMKWEKNDQDEYIFAVTDDVGEILRKIGKKLSKLTSLKCDLNEISGDFYLHFGVLHEATLECGEQKVKNIISIKQINEYVEHYHYLYTEFVELEDLEKPKIINVITMYDEY